MLSHARALLATSDGVTAVGADLSDPGGVLAWRAWMPEPVMRHREGHVLAGVAHKPQAMPRMQPGRG